MVEKRAREVHGRSSARGPSDRTLIPFKGEARRRYAAAHRVGGKEGREREKERKREEGRSRARSRLGASEGRGPTQNGDVRGRDSEGGGRGVERGTLFAERSR